MVFSAFGSTFLEDFYKGWGMGMGGVCCIGLIGKK